MNPASSHNHRLKQKKYLIGFAPLGVFVIIALVVTAGIGGYMFISEKKIPLLSFEKISDNIPLLKNSADNLQGVWIYEKQYLARADTDFVEVPSSQNHTAYTEFKKDTACIDGTLNTKGRPIACKTYYSFSVAGQTLLITTNRPDQGNIQGEWNIKGDLLEVTMKLNANPPGQKMKLVLKKYTGSFAPEENDPSLMRKTPLKTEMPLSVSLQKIPPQIFAYPIPQPSKQTTAKPTPFCGDNICNGDETNFACSQDCHAMTTVEIAEGDLMPSPTGTHWVRSYDFSMGEYDLPEPFQRMELLDGREVRFSFFNTSESKITARDIVSQMMLVYPKERRMQALERTSLLAGPSDTTEELSNPGIGTASKAFKFSSPDGKTTHVVAIITKGYNVVLTVKSGLFGYDAVLDLVKKALNKIEVYSSLR